VRVGGSTAYDDDTFSSLKDTMLFPSAMRKHEPVWAAGRQDGKLDEQGMFHAQSMQGELDHPPADWLVLERNYSTQSIDTAALEPDNTNCWYDAATQSLHMVVPTQGPHEVRRKRCRHGGEVPVPGEEPARASGLYGGLRFEGSLHRSVLRTGRGHVWRRPSGTSRV